MAKKRFTFAMAKEEIKELKQELAELKDKAILDTTDNIYTADENKTIIVYKYGFWILAAVNAALIISLLF